MNVIVYRTSTPPGGASVNNGISNLFLITPWLPHTVTHVSAMEQETQSGRNRFGETSPCSIFTFTHCNFLLFSLDLLLQNPRVALEELKLDRSYLIHFPPWYSKSGHFPIEVPIKNEKWPLNLSYGSIFYNSENPFVGSFLHNIVHHLVHHTPFTKYGHLSQCSQLCKPW